MASSSGVGDGADVPLAEEQLDVDQSNAAPADTDAEEAAATEREAKKRKVGGGGAGGKAQRKKSLFKGYDTEKNSFSLMATSINGTGESRPATALDDVIAALRFVTEMLQREGLIQKLPEDDDKFLATFSFCVGLFLEFAWQGRCSVNGKEYRQYSALRTELQQTMIDALQSLRSPEFAVGSATQQSAGGGSNADKEAGASQKTVTPLQLAEMLCATFCDKPVTEIVWDDEDPDTCTLRNIVNVMSTKAAEVIEPLTDFVAKTQHMPLPMHKPVSVTLTELFGTKGDATLSLLDIVSVAYKNINKELPFAWAGFGFDCMAAFAERGHFVENTQQARPRVYFCGSCEM